MNASRFSFASFALGLFLAAGAARALAVPFVPRDDDQVLARVTSARDPVTRQLREQQCLLAANRTNLPLAADLVRALLQRNRLEGDPRYLGRAEAILDPWWDLPDPPLDALVLRAVIKQSEHHFSAALGDLDRAVHRAPANAQAWLTRATILTVLGRYEEARPACLALARVAPELVVVTASATIAGLTGQAERSCDALRQALDRNPSATVPEKIWALTTLAETLTRLGRLVEADRAFRQALALGEHDVYLLGAYADLLLDEGSPSQVIDLLKNETQADALLLRLTIAEAALPRAPGFRSHRQLLTDRFAEAALRGDNLHQREQAMFTLKILNAPEEALRCARANWDVQREPADARILLESALAAQRPEMASPVLAFVQTNRLEDVHLNGLQKALRALATSNVP